MKIHSYDFIYILIDLQFNVARVKKEKYLSPLLKTPYKNLKIQYLKCIEKNVEFEDYIDILFYQN